MGQRQFDDLTRALAGGRSRRDVLKVLVASLGSIIAAVFVARLDYPEADAATIVGLTTSIPTTTTSTTTKTTTTATCPACGPSIRTT